MRRVLVRVVAALWAGCGLAAGQSAGQEALKPPPMPWPYEVLRAARTPAQASYLDAALTFIEREEDARADQETLRTYLDIAPWFFVWVGEHARALKMEDEFRAVINYPRGAMTQERSPDGHRTEPAVEWILRAAADRRVVMFNEEHRSSVQRAFMHRVLDGLAEQGYTHLALEALSGRHNVNERGHPTLTDGTYLRDPVFGDLVRRARQLGMTLVAYDTFDFAAGGPGENPEERENRRDAWAAGQLQKVLDDPKAKLIVFAGRGHISELPAGGWRPMCSVLKEATGLDPLTCELETMVEHHDREWEHEAYRRADERGDLKGDAIVYVTEAGEPWSALGAYDVSVFHPRAREEQGRPHYLTLGGARQPVETGVEAKEEPLLVQARASGETEDAVPADQVIAWPGKGPAKLLLRAGSYEIVVLNRKGEEKQRRAVVVE
jgi:hypothetical protein